MAQAMMAVKKQPFKFRPLSILYYLAILTSSFDIFLVLNLGFTFRISQLLLIFPIAVGLASAAFKFSRTLKVSCVLLVAWALVQVAALLFHGVTPRGLGYTLWLWFYAALLISTPSLFKSESKVITLLRVYIWSFTLVSLFGVVQFFAGMAGSKGFLIKQWWIEGSLPRVNGFSYEPSYFATYLILGWITLACLLENRRLLRSQRVIKHPGLHFAVVTIALLLSSSRMGIIAMAGWSLYLLARLAFNFKMKLSRAGRAIALSPIVVATLLLVFWPSFANKSEDLLLFLDGTGLGGTASHSVDVRSNSFGDTLEVFREHPMGVGLGGVAEELARKDGLDPLDRDDVKSTEGMCVSAEILAGTGVIGFVLASAFFFRVWKFGELAKAPFAGGVSLFLPPLISALLVELLLLQLNQNILRQFLWQHIAVLFAVAACAKKTRFRQLALLAPYQITEPELARVTALN